MLLQLRRPSSSRDRIPFLKCHAGWRSINQTSCGFLLHMTVVMGDHERSGIGALVPEGRSHPQLTWLIVYLVNHLHAGFATLHGLIYPDPSSLEHSKEIISRIAPIFMMNRFSYRVYSGRDIPPGHVPSLNR